MTVGQSFDDFCDNIMVPQTKEVKIVCRKNEIAKRINKDFRGVDNSIRNTLYVGSYGRCTDNVDVSDIDLLVILPWQVYSRFDQYRTNGQSALLQEVKRSIGNRYPSTEIRGDGQVVQVSFSDNMMFEVVPCFEYSDGTFCYPDTNGGGCWKKMNPRVEIKAVQDRNNETNHNMSKLCRMIRSWKDTNNVSIKGITIDILVHRFLYNYKYRSESFIYYDYMTRDFFYYLMNIPIEQSHYLVMGSNRYIYDFGCFQNKAEKAYNLVVEAISADRNGYFYTRNQKFRDVFGSRFPTNR